MTDEHPPEHPPGHPGVHVEVPHAHLPHPHRPTREEMAAIYRRRRVAALVVLVLFAWSTVKVVGGVADWVGGDDASAHDRAAPTTVDRGPCPDGLRSFPDTATDPIPEALAANLDEAAQHQGFTLQDPTVSVWIEGYGEVVAIDADRELVPASNQKILTGIGILLLLPHDGRLTTEIVANGPVAADGTLDGDLIVVGGGDPTIKREGPHSVAEIAKKIKAAGITRITGDIVGDESRYDALRRAKGWLDLQMPLPGGAMSALMVNSNQRVGEVAYLANPTTHNANLFKLALEDIGIDVEGVPRPGGAAPKGAKVITTYDSPTFAEMTKAMLTESENMVAEMLVKEIGLRESNEGSTRAGLDAIRHAIRTQLCVDLGGYDDDASGISRSDKRAAREWRHLLMAAKDQPWFDTFFGGLPLSATEPGTLKNRFVGTSAAGKVRAKTGTVSVSRSLSGYTTTGDGREAVFSIIVNGDDWGPAEEAMDRLVLVLTDWNAPPPPSATSASTT